MLWTNVGLLADCIGLIQTSLLFRAFSLNYYWNTSSRTVRWHRCTCPVNGESTSIQRFKDINRDYQLNVQPHYKPFIEMSSEVREIFTVTKRAIICHHWEEKWLWVWAKLLVQTHLVKSVISIMIMHICFANTMMSLPLSSHLETSASSLLFSSWKLATCSAIFAFCSWGNWAMIAWRRNYRSA